MTTFHSLISLESLMLVSSGDHAKLVGVRSHVGSDVSLIDPTQPFRCEISFKGPKGYKTNVATELSSSVDG